MNALKLDRTTGESVPIQIDDDVVRSFFKGDVRGKTLRELHDGIFLREWTQITPKSSLSILDAYDGTTLKRVDMPVPSECISL
jgi:hypothetical protein